MYIGTAPPPKPNMSTRRGCFAWDLASQSLSVSVAICRWYGNFNSSLTVAVHRQLPLCPTSEHVGTGLFKSAGTHLLSAGTAVAQCTVDCLPATSRPITLPLES